MNRPRVVNQPTTSKHLAYGINLIADLLAPTLGPMGGAVAHRVHNTRMELLNDSSTVVRRIIGLRNAQEDIGAMVMRNLIWRVGQRAGDGGATAAVLARALFQEGLRQVSAGANAMQLANGVRLGVDAAVAALQCQSRPITTENELASVAMSVYHRRDLASVLAEMVYLLGPDANVIIDKLVAPYLERRYIAGAHYKAQISSMYFYTSPQNKRSLLVSPVVAIVDENLSNAEQVIPLLEGALQRGAKAIAIITRDVSGGALQMLAGNNQLPKEKKKLDIFACKLQTLGDETRWALSDLALMTGATVLGGSYDRSGRTARPEDLGTAKRVDYSQAGLVVVANDESRSQIQANVGELRAQLSGMTLDDEDRPKVIRRLSTLTGGVGELKIGANSQPERDLLDEQTQRVLRVLSSAMRSGVVAGGGAALHHAACEVRKVKAEGEVAVGVKLLADVLSAPMRQILCNAGVSSTALYLQKVTDAGVPYTFDALQGEVVNAFNASVLDVTEVVTQVLQTAVSGALMALTTDAIVYHKKPKESMEP